MNADKLNRHADGDGLCLTVRSGESKQWISLFRSNGRLREMGLGSQQAERAYRRGDALEKRRRMIEDWRIGAFHGLRLTTVPEHSQTVQLLTRGYI